MTDDSGVSPQDTETDSDDVPQICLDQFLKTCGVATGGQAKRMIQGGEVLVNDQIETRRRKKLKPGDEVQIYDDIFVVALAEPEPDPDQGESETPEPVSEPKIDDSGKAAQ